MGKRFTQIWVVWVVSTGCVATDDDHVPLATEESEVSIVPGSTTCADQGLGDHELVIPAPVTGTYSIDGVNTLGFHYYDATGTVFFFTGATLRMDGVLVHAAGTTTVFPLDEANGWPSLGAIDPDPGVWLVPESVSFCYDYELFLNPNGYAHRGRRHAWDIAKTGPASPLALAPGGSVAAPYAVTVTPTGWTDAGRFFAGPVFVNNPSPYEVTIQAVTVDVGGIPATVTCPVALPHTIPPFTTLTCELFAEVPDEADRLLYVDVVSDGSLEIDRSLETGSFGSHTTTVLDFDECVAVYDDHVPGDLLGSACVAGGAQTFTYSSTIGPFATCGPFEVTNLAWFETNDSGTSESATWNVTGAVPCGAGCTRTQGYWKTHSEYGPAPYDATWALLPAGANTPFFLSGTSYLAVFNTQPAGNPYYILAHQYAAAKLNQLSGASLSSISTTFAEATQLLATYTPAQVKTGPKSLKIRATLLALVLAAYNEGWIGPGHCDGGAFGCQ